MAKRDNSIDSSIYEVLKPLLERRGLNISKIVLFGSYAKQAETENSDIDLIIVSRDFRDKSVFERVELTTGIGRTLVKTFKKPFDLMFYSDLEWDRSRSIVVNAARSEGKELHGKATR
jgi:predicted nucleotidyltransferase